MSGATLRFFPHIFMAWAAATLSYYLFIYFFYLHLQYFMDDEKRLKFFSIFIISINWIRIYLCSKKHRKSCRFLWKDIAKSPLFRRKFEWLDIYKYFAKSPTSDFINVHSSVPNLLQACIETDGHTNKIILTGLARIQTGLKHLWVASKRMTIFFFLIFVVRINVVVFFTICWKLSLNSRVQSRSCVACLLALYCTQKPQQLILLPFYWSRRHYTRLQAPSSSCLVK